MERRVRERLVGALVLVAIVVLVVPAVLTGRGSGPDDAPVQPRQPSRREVLPAAEGAPAIEDDRLVPEAVTDEPVTKARVRPAVPAATEPASWTAATAAPTKPAAMAAPTAPAPTPAPVENAQSSAWAVQLGAFSNRAKAEQLVEQLRKRQYPAFLLEYRAGGQVLYRVRVGPEQDRSRAQEIAARLAKDGFEPVVARHP